MLAALDFALSVRWILRWIFDRHSRQIQSDDFEPASSALPQWLESVPSMRHTRGQDVSPPNPFQAMPEDSKTVWATVCNLLVLRLHVRARAEVPLAE